MTKDPLAQCGAGLVLGGNRVDVIGVYAHMGPHVSYEPDQVSAGPRWGELPPRGYHEAVQSR